MASGDQLQAKIKATLLSLQATSRVVKFREVTQVDGHPRLGIGGTITVTETDIAVQPAVELVRSDEIAGSAGILMPGDYRFTFDGTVSEDLLRTQQILYGSEVLHIVHVEPHPFKGVIAAWTVIARTMQTRS